MDHLGEKEAAGNVPFLGQVVEGLDITLGRQHLLDPQFVVAHTEGRGRSLTCDFAIVQVTVISSSSSKKNVWL